VHGKEQKSSIAFDAQIVFLNALANNAIWQTPKAVDLFLQER
jgi:hypothetical protein